MIQKSINLYLSLSQKYFKKIEVPITCYIIASMIDTIIQMIKYE